MSKVKDYLLGKRQTNKLVIGSPVHLKMFPHYGKLTIRDIDHDSELAYFVKNSRIQMWVSLTDLNY